MARMSKVDWLNAGAKILAYKGTMALTIDRLCEDTGMTKGSFYHHFENFQAYKLALLAHYENEGTSKIIDIVEQIAEPAEKLKRLFALAAANPQRMEDKLEVMLRAWALQDDDVRAVQERVDARRIEYVFGLCMEITGDEARSLLIARMAYALLIGTEHVQPPFPHETALRLFEDLLQQYDIA